MELRRDYTARAVDPVVLANDLGISFQEVSLRLRITRDYARALATHPTHRRRVLRAVLEVALERERLEAMLG